MGCSCSIIKEEESNKLIKLSRKMFVINGLIGEGGFGKVWAATLPQNGKWYAVKEINKVKNEHSNG